jgi:hypothetical protein
MGGEPNRRNIVSTMSIRESMSPTDEFPRISDQATFFEAVLAMDEAQEAFLSGILFSIVYLSPPWPDAVDPMGKVFTLSREGKAALALFLLAGTWWVFEVLPIGVTG